MQWGPPSCLPNQCLGAKAQVGLTLLSSASDGPFAAPAGALSLCSKGSVGTKGADVIEVRDTQVEVEGGYEVKLRQPCFSGAFTISLTLGSGVQQWLEGSAREGKLKESFQPQKS